MRERASVRRSLVVKITILLISEMGKRKKRTTFTIVDKAQALDLLDALEENGTAVLKLNEKSKKKKKNILRNVKFSLPRKRSASTTMLENPQFLVLSDFLVKRSKISVSELLRSRKIVLMKNLLVCSVHLTSLSNSCFMQL